jgi:tRNA (guanosine-2'-O-)-methyltransferase
MTIDQKKKIFNELSTYLSPKRAQKIVQYAYERTRYVTVVLEDINQTHNISAALRSCECFGVQDVSIIEERYSYAVNHAVCKGASQWLDIYTYHEPKINNTEKCFEILRKKGYRLAATSPVDTDLLIDELPLDQKVALVFGTEERGLSSYALNNADLRVKIPTYGFTQSLNISVSVAICLYEITKRLRKSNYAWQLTEEEIIDLQLEWLGRSTNRTQQIKELITAHNK